MIQTNKRKELADMQNEDEYWQGLSDEEFLEAAERGEVDIFPWGKHEKGDKIWWKWSIPTEYGPMIFSFDKVHEFNLFGDWDKLTPEQKEIFRKENPGLAKLKRD